MIKRNIRGDKHMLIYFYSYQFIAFFIVFASIFWIIPKRYRALYLLTGSYVFYSNWDWRFSSLLIVSTITDYYCSHQIQKSNEPMIRKYFLYLSMVINLGILGFFKYFNFFIDNLSELLVRLGMNPIEGIFEVVLPLGISFYTFQTMGYTIDVYYRRIKAVEKFVDFSLYVAFFPQLIAGPIEKAKNLIPQLSSIHSARMSHFKEGFFLFMYGLFQKRVLADSLGVLVEKNSEAWKDSEFGGIGLVLAYAFLMQVYCDFSGYSKMARGIAYFLGIKLSRNFNSPLWAKNPSDFWSRWHITLSGWVRQYLYFPLLVKWKNPVAVSAVCFPLIGLWHGATWGHVGWGVYWFLFTVIYNLPQKNYGKSRLPVPFQFIQSFLARIVLFNISAVGIMLVKFESIHDFFIFLKHIFVSARSLSILPFMEKSLIISFVFLLVFELIQKIKKDEFFIVRMNFYYQGMFYLLLFFIYRQIENIGDYQFIYFQF